MGVRRALLVGCNYPGSNAALNGCVNDVKGMDSMIQKYFGFKQENITIMIDTDQSYTQPTGKNIKEKLRQLVDVSQDGDVIFFHFSGHGTQVPGEDPEEQDRKDEAICPTDMNVITDGDLREIFMPLSQKKGVRLQFVADCCHSGTLLDHDTVIITGPKPGMPPPPPVDTGAIQSMLAALGAKRDLKNRALPINDLMGMLSQMLGKDVNQSNVRSSMGTLFGADASRSIQTYVQYAQTAMKLLQGLNGGGQSGQAAAGGGGAGGGGCMGLLGMCFSAVSAAGAAGGGSSEAVKPPPPGTKPPPGSRLDDDVGVLITGCMDKETSADACPSGNPAHAFGALSHALQTTVANHFQATPNQPITNRNLVLGVREILTGAGYAQSPCLECAEGHADDPFICKPAK